MSGILEDIGLKKHLHLTLKMDRSDFTKMLETKVNPNRLFLFDILDNEQKEFYGSINENNFWLRKADRFIPKNPFTSAFGVVN